MRESWTDDRMDDLSAKVDRVDADVRGLRVEMKTEFATVRGEMRDCFEKVDKRFDKIDERFDKIDARFEKADERFERFEARSDERFERLEARGDERFERLEVRGDERFEAMMDRLYSMQRLMIQFYGGLFAALIVALTGLVATQL